MEAYNIPVRGRGAHLRLILCIHHFHYLSIHSYHKKILTGDISKVDAMLPTYYDNTVKGVTGEMTYFLPAVYQDYARANIEMVKHNHETPLISC